MSRITTVHGTRTEPVGLERRFVTVCKACRDQPTGSVRDRRFFLFLLVVVVVVVVEKPWSLEGRSFHLRWLCSSMNVIHPSVNGFSLQTITPSFIFGVGIFFFHPQEMLTGQENQSNRGKSRKLKNKIPGET